MERDEESGLSYHTARCYLPWLGRWGCADPIGIGDGVNLYRYAKSNPISNIDFDGLQSVGTLRDIAESKRKEISKKRELYSDYSKHPEQYPTVTEETKAALKAEISAMEKSAKGWEDKAVEEIKEHSSIIKGDFYEGETTARATVIQIWMGVTPGLGQAADVRDLLANTKKGSGIGILFAAIAFFPGIGDLAKSAYKVTSKLPAPRILSQATKNIDQILTEAADQGRHILKVDFFDKANEVIDSFWVISGAGGKFGHTEYQAIVERMLKKSGMDEKTVFILMQGVLMPCSTRNGAHSCHDLLRLVAERGKEVVYSTEALRQDFGFTEGSIRLYEAGKGYLKKNVDEWTKAPKEVVKKIEDSLK
jgi:RHS repeat-associated protein